MKKIKNTVLNQKEECMENIKEGKIRKVKNKKSKKQKDVTKLASKIEQASEPSKNDGNVTKSKKKNKKNKNKLAHQQEKPEVIKDQANEPPQKSAKVENQTEKKKKVKKANLKEEMPTTNAVSGTVTENHKELSEAEIKKIEKKKAKKLAQKLKKQQKRKETSKTDNVDSAKTNGVKEKQTHEEFGSTSTKVLTKKEKKAKKRQLIKEQKLAEKQTRDPAIEAATIFVGNLPVNTKRVQIVSLFKEYAPVNSIRLRSAGGKVLHKHKQRKEAGSLNAYVVLKDKETAEKAVSLNGIEFKGHHLRVTLASKSPNQHEKEEGKRTIFVGNLKYSATEKALREVFSSCGEIDYVRCLRDGDKGCKGVAYVCFKTPDSVGLALELNETMLDERPIHVERFSVKKLGAKEAREAQAEKVKSSKEGAKKRLDGEKAKKDKSLHKQKEQNTENDDKKTKKSTFRGVKVEALKKKQKLKKKKSNNQMIELAKKIAPKPKTE